MDDDCDHGREAIFSGGISSFIAQLVLDCVLFQKLLVSTVLPNHSVYPVRGPNDRHGPMIGPKFPEWTLDDNYRSTWNVSVCIRSPGGAR